VTVLPSSRAGPGVVQEILAIVSPGSAVTLADASGPANTGT
jgi:hypothetical protein